MRRGPTFGKTFGPTLVFGTNLVLGAAALGWVLVRFGGPALALLGRAPSVPRLVLFALVVVAAFVAFALRWRVVLDGLGAACGLGRLTLYRAAGQSISSIVPSAKLGGEPVRAYLLVDDARVPAAPAIASVVVDRTLEMGAAAAFACLFVTVLVQRGVPALEGALVSVALGAAGLVLGVTLTVRRLRQGRGLVTAAARALGLDRLRLVRERMDVLAAAEAAAVDVVRQRGRLGAAFALGLAANAVILVEYHLLLSAFALPATPLAVVAAVFATGAAHSLPIPAAVGALEGAQMFIFGALGHPPAVGLAVGLAVRLRELCWIVPGLLYLLVRALVARRRAAPTPS